MKRSQTVNYILIVIGVLVSMYAKVDANQNTYLLIFGICCLLFGIFRISQTIPSKSEKEDDNIDEVE
ncbi:hypothetical protein [Formosa haliotis]|uniref:hypothetical protein n=1 Tax=Formosa haliotis TaxID=1555194 RepID=UPI0008262338|nr:hypothetical protein [Formosa haliotis]